MWAPNERVSVLKESRRTVKTVDESFPSGVARDGHASSALSPSIFSLLSTSKRSSSPHGTTFKTT